MTQVTLQIIADSALDLRRTLSELGSLTGKADQVVTVGGMEPDAPAAADGTAPPAPKPINKYAVADADGKLVYDGNKAAEAADEFIALIENAGSVEELIALGDANEDLAQSLSKAAGKKATAAFAAKREEFNPAAKADAVSQEPETTGVPPIEDALAVGRSVVENVGAKALMEMLIKHIPSPDVKRQISNVPEAQRAAFVADCEKALADRQKEVARGVKP